MSATLEQQELTRTINILKLTLPRMSQLDIPITPENYAIWYEYTKGESKELIAAIDELIESGASFDRKTNNYLYHRFVGYVSSESLESIQGETQLLVDNILKTLRNMQADNESFSGTLNNCQDVLQKQPDLETITELVTALMTESEQVKQTNLQMEQALSSMNDELTALKNEIQTLNTTSLTDQLTNIPNRRAYDEAIDNYFFMYKEESQIFSLLMIDIDHFKQFNDTFGHAVGDKVLTYVAASLKKSIKGGDFVARFGGEEFVILLPATNYEGALIVGNQIRKNVAKKNLITGIDQGKTALGNISISVGAAVINSEDNKSSLIERADKALYLAKKRGRDQVIGEKELKD